MSSWFSLSLFVHLFALALWIGGAVFFLVVMAPAVRDFESRIGAAVLNQARAGFEKASWIAIGLVLVSGMTNLFLRMTAGAPGESYGILLALKLIVFSAMIAHHCLQVFKYSPEIAKLTAELSTAANAWPESLLSSWRGWSRLLKMNAALGPIAVMLGLALTGD